MLTSLRWGLRCRRFRNLPTRDVFSDCNDYCTATVGCNVVAADSCSRSCLTNCIDGTPFVWRLSVDSTNACEAPEMIVQRWTIASSHSPWAHPRIYRLRKPSVRCLMHVFFFEECDRSWNEYVSAGPDVLKCVYDSLRLACHDLFEVDQACFGATANRLRRECTLYCSAQSACGEDK